jgi:hypothetical protein
MLHIYTPTKLTSGVFSTSVRRFIITWVIGGLPN